MSLFSQAEVQKVAHLARLALPPADISRYTKELTSILELVRQMESIDTVGIVPLAHPRDVGQRLRSDLVSEVDQRDLFQNIAPQVEEGLYLVPIVIE